jgi:hypothetical protein
MIGRQPADASTDCANRPRRIRNSLRLAIEKDLEKYLSNDTLIIIY